MRPDRSFASACLVALALLFFAADAHAQTATMGTPSHLARHELGGWDGCAIRDGDAILTAQREGLYWLDGKTGALRRSVKLPGWRRYCGIASIDAAATHGFVIASDAAYDAIDVVVVSPAGAVKAHRTVPGNAFANIDVVTIGETVYIGSKAPHRATNDLYALSTRTLDVLHTYRLPRIAALVRSGAEAIAVLPSGEAFALRDTAVPTNFVFPPPTGPHGLHDPSEKTPVRLASGLHARFEPARGHYGGMLRIVREDGSVVAERLVDGKLAWFDAEMSTVIPWDDGVRLLVTANDTTLLHVLRVPFSVGP